MVNRIGYWALGLLLAMGLGNRGWGDEGMFPISDLKGLNLAEKGLMMDPNEIFNSDGNCLVDGICRVNGCTGSFISSDGLIITNHHCAFAAIQKASTPEHDYLANGFFCKSRAEEIPSPGYTVRITESFEDVSQQVLSVVRPEMTFEERTKAIEKQQKVLEKEAEASNPGKRAEVAEMFVGKRYVRFLYTFIKDVRLVFAPPYSVGNFGGEVDNWEWPRHTGDFSFMRAYVAPDGSSADYSPDNVPYHPNRVIRVQPKGVQENDFVMLLGYPGRTVRHNTASFLNYEEQVRLPYIVDLYAWEIKTMEEAGKNDRAVALKLASRIKSLANVEKRSRGQLVGLKKVQFVAKRQAEEKILRDAVPEAASLLDRIDAVYHEMSETAALELNLKNLVSASQMMSLAFTVVDAVHERTKDDLVRESAYTDREFPQTKQRLQLQQRDLHLPVDKVMFAELIRRIQMAKGTTDMEAFAGLKGAEGKGNTESIDALFDASHLSDEDFLNSCLSKTPEELRKTDDPLIQLAFKLYERYLAMRATDKDREGRLSQLYGELFAAKQKLAERAPVGSIKPLVPDANGTLRLTYGRVEGYSPNDAIYMMPFTSIQGMLDKVTGADPFECPERIVEMHAKRDFGNYESSELGDVPVSLLYSTDTTGGNSGSPILNAKGELVGVNFDRTFNATINDFAWDAEYSRSIGVDIRYVLWITDRVYGASHLIEEITRDPAPKK